MSDETMKALDIFSLPEACGDPVPNAGGKRARRRMNYAGQSWGSHIYKCPICGRQRKFMEKFFGGFNETT